MKIGEKIRKVSQLDEVIKRRAQLNAIGYLFKNNENRYIQWNCYKSNSKENISLSIWGIGQGDTAWFEEPITITMKPLNDY